MEVKIGIVQFRTLLCDKVKHRGKRYLPGRILHTSNGTSSFQIKKHLLICGDVSSNPGPGKKPTAKYPCGECHKNVRNNQDAILCVICKSWFHAKCLNMSRNIFRYYLAHPDIDWTCALCSLPPLSDSFFSEDSVRFGASLQKGIVAVIGDLWKRGEWIPAFKKDDPLDKENYRPVTVLSAVDKVFEQLISKQITAQFESRLSDSITAYRKSHSCETTLVSLVEQWKLARDGHQCVAILSTDMSKAFDPLHPPLMLNKLRAYGFAKNIVNLLRSYLSNRQNRIRLGSLASSWQVVNRGCPQGSALGPLLWNIFQNDLAYEINLNLSMYPDDHQIYEAGKDLANVKSSLSRNAEKASNWYEDNMLKGNYIKYRTMTMQNKREITTPTMSIQGSEIESTEKLNLLGVTIDSKLNFNHHIKGRVSRFGACASDNASAVKPIVFGPIRSEYTTPAGYGGQVL